MWKEAIASYFETTNLSDAQASGAQPFFHRGANQTEVIW
jgi:thiamine monophosphate kinase